MDLTGSLRDLFKQMSETQQGFPPLMFLNALRTAFPQFAQKSKDGHGYAQQDAEEAWSQIVSQLRQKLKIKDTPGASDGQAAQDMAFIDKNMAGKFESVMECDEPGAKEGGEEPTHTEDLFFKLMRVRSTSLLTLMLASPCVFHDTTIRSRLLFGKMLSLSLSDEMSPRTVGIQSLKWR